VEKTPTNEQTHIRGVLERVLADWIKNILMGLRNGAYFAKLTVLMGLEF